MKSLSASLVDVWTAGGAGGWKTAANWSLGRAPQTGDAVDVEAGSPFIVTNDIGPLTLAGLTLVGATLDLVGSGGAATLTSTGATTLQNATIGGAWPLILAGASTIKQLTVGGSAYLNNKGTATQSGGAVAIGDGASSTAYILNAASATWVVADASGMTQSTTSRWRFYNYGTFQKTSGAGFAIIQANFWSVGTIASSGGGDIVFDGKSTYLAGTYIGAGMVDYGPDGVARIGDVHVTASSCQSNFGTVNLVGTMTMNDGSTIMNAAGAHWNFAGDSALALGAGQTAGPDINGPGVIAKTQGTGTSHIGVVVTAEGAVSVLTGTLSFEGATSAFSSLVNGAGTFQIGGGAATIASGARLTVSHWTLAGGVTTLGENVGYAGAFAGAAGATLDLGGYALITSGATTLAGLALGGTGVLRLNAATTVTGLTVGGMARVVATAKVTQGAGVEVTLGDASAADAAQLIVGAGGVWLLNGGGVGVGADPASSIYIAASGLLASGGADASTVAPTVFNNGADAGSTLGGLEVSSGRLDVSGKVYGTGSANIVGAATLEFDNYVSAGQSVLFSGAQGALSLGDLADFHAGVSGFDTVGADDSLLIGGGWSFAGATATTSAATLSFTQGALHHALTLQGDYAGGVFSAATVGGLLKVTF